MADPRTVALQQAVSELTEYFVGERTMRATLERVAELTIVAMPQTFAVGLTLMVDGKPGTAVFTDPEIPEIDETQYRTGDGPCLDAFKTGRTHIIESMVEPGPWQPHRQAAAAHGVLSSLSLPLQTREARLGAMNLYATSERAYSAADLETAMAFGSQASFVLANAQAYWDAYTLSENLERALTSRAAIEQAKGIIMAAQGCTPDEAMQQLIRQSQHENIKVRDLAAEIVRRVRRPPRAN